MKQPFPEDLQAERASLEAEIREAFKGISRANGVSWSESKVLDMYGSDEECEAARKQDLDRSWEELIDDPNWDCELGIGGFNFLDEISYLYYIAPAMIRSMRSGYGESVEFALGRLGSLLQTVAQRRAVGRFVRFMIARIRVEFEDSEGFDIMTEGWRGALDRFQDD